MSAGIIMFLVVLGAIALVAFIRLGVLAWLGWRPTRSRARSIARAADVLSCLGALALLLPLSLQLLSVPVPLVLGLWWALIVPLGIVSLAGLVLRFPAAPPGWERDRVRMIISGALALAMIGFNVFASLPQLTW